MTSIRLLADGPACGARNMAVDEALMDAARQGRATLRMYRWNPACLSLGRNERARGAYDAAEAARRGMDIVRRPTGGRAVYHDDELTYAVVAPAGLWGGLRESYARINRALARGLRALGVSAEASASPSLEALRGGGHDARPRPSTAAGACFAQPAPGEVTAAGRKLVGSAQWRHDGAFLQHGSLLLTNGQVTVAALHRNRARRAEVSDPATLAASSSSAVGLEELLGRRPALGELRAALVNGFEEELECAVEPGELSAAEREAATSLEARYRDESWTWRR